MTYDDLPPIMKWSIETIILLFMLKAYNVIDWSFGQIIFRVTLFNIAIQIVLWTIDAFLSLLIWIIQSIRRWLE